MVKPAKNEECESGTIILIQQTRGRLHNYEVIKQQPSPESNISGIFCAGVTGGSWLPPSRGLSPAHLYYVETGHQTHHAGYVLLCCAQLLIIYILPFQLFIGLRYFFYLPYPY